MHANSRFCMLRAPDELHADRTARNLFRPTFISTLWSAHFPVRRKKKKKKKTQIAHGVAPRAGDRYATM
jgi:hypothetical protein